MGLIGLMASAVIGRVATAHLLGVIILSTQQSRIRTGESRTRATTDENSGVEERFVGSISLQMTITTSLLSASTARDHLF